jgi:hypothetical protein
MTVDVGEDEGEEGEYQVAVDENAAAAWLSCRPWLPTFTAGRVPDLPGVGGSSPGPSCL